MAAKGQNSLAGFGMDVEDLDSIELSPEDMALLEQDAADIGATDADLEAELDGYAAVPAAGAARSRPVPAPDRATHHAAAYVGGSAAAYGGEEDEAVLATDATAAQRPTAMDVSDAADDDELLAQLSAPSAIATGAASRSSGSVAQRPAPSAAASRATTAASASAAATAAAAPTPVTAAAASRPVVAATAAGARGKPSAAPAAAPAIVLAPDAFELAKALGAQFADLKQRAQALAVSTTEQRASLVCDRTEEAKRPAATLELSASVAVAVPACR
jgi:hypothetical protein